MNNEPLHEEYILSDNLVALEMIAMGGILKDCLRNIFINEEEGFADYGEFVYSIVDSSPERRWALLGTINIMSRSLLKNMKEANQTEYDNILANLDRLDSSIPKDAKVGIKDGAVLMMSNEPIEAILSDNWLIYISNKCPVERYSGLMLMLMSTCVSIVKEMAKIQDIEPLVLWDYITRQANQYL